MVNMLKGKIDQNKRAGIPTGIWENINFLEKMDDIPKETDKLVKEVQRLKIEKGLLGSELENVKGQLTIQVQLNEDMKTLQDYENKRYKAHIKMLNEKIRLLIESIDRTKLPKDFDFSLSLTHSLNKIYVPAENSKEPENKSGLNPQLSFKGEEIDKVSSSNFSNNESESQYAVDENALDLYVTHAKIDQEFARQNLKVEPDNLMTFITVDFFYHETQASNLMENYRPNYNLQLSFKITVNEHFIKYIQEEYINVDLYYSFNGEGKILGKGKIPLSQIITAETNETTRIIVGYCQILSTSEPSIKVADIKYKMRMRLPIIETLRWMAEKNEMYNQLNPINKANLKMIQFKDQINVKSENLDYYASKELEQNINKKVYAVKIIVERGENLVAQSKKNTIKPYIYYKFHNHNEHFSEIYEGCSPVFEDKAEYVCVYTDLFHEYLEKDYLTIYIFDNSESLQLDRIGREVEIVEDEKGNDLIGICKVRLRSLIIKSKIEGKFELTNEEETCNVGYVYLSISATEVKSKDDLDKISMGI